jgi:hypothetical protein
VETLTTAVVLPEPPPPPAVPPSVAALNDGDTAFGAREFHKAVAHYQNYLLFEPLGTQRPRVLLQLAVSHVLADARDWDKAAARLRTLINDYPESPYHPVALIMMRMRSDLSAVSAQKDEIEKKVKDLQQELLLRDEIDKRTRRAP